MNLNCSVYLGSVLKIQWFFSAFSAVEGAQKEEQNTLAAQLPKTIASMAVSISKYKGGALLRGSGYLVSG